MYCHLNKVSSDKSKILATKSSGFWLREQDEADAFYVDLNFFNGDAFILYKFSGEFWMTFSISSFSVPSSLTTSTVFLLFSGCQ